MKKSIYTFIIIASLTGTLGAIMKILHADTWIEWLLLAIASVSYIMLWCIAYFYFFKRSYWFRLLGNKK
jgi:hypothetical protein